MLPDEVCATCGGKATYGCVSVYCPYPMADPNLSIAGTVIWRKGSPPKDEPGQYLIWLGGKYANDRQLGVYNIHRCVNGFIRTVNGHMDYEYLDKDCYIVAWATSPGGPNET